MGRVSLCIVFFLYLVASVIAASNECGRQNNGNLCDNRVCCSCWGECGTDDYHCLRSYGCQSNCEPEGDHDTNVEAFYTDFDPAAHNWSLSAIDVACATKDGGNSLEWRSKYNWTGFCGKVGAQGLDACGMCLRVTNSESGAEVILRIVDTCGNGALEIDEPSFKQIDTNGNGMEQGHLIVDYEFVDCGDDASSFISMKSMI